MYLFVKKYFLNCLLSFLIVGMLLVSIFFIVATQNERDAAGVRVRRMEDEISSMREKIKRSELKRDSLCSATRLWKRNEVKTAFQDISDAQVIRVRILRVPYGRGIAVEDNPRSRAIELAALTSPYLPAESKNMRR